MEDGANRIFVFLCQISIKSFCVSREMDSIIFGLGVSMKMCKARCA